jgi:hypothetical protein
MITPDSIDTALIRRTMRAILYEEAKTAVTRFIDETVADSEPNSWDSSFEDYIEAHKNLGFPFCRYSKSTVIIFCPSDRHGIWEMQRVYIRAIVPDSRRVRSVCETRPLSDKRILRRVPSLAKASTKPPVPSPRRLIF